MLTTQPQLHTGLARPAARLAQEPARKECKEPQTARLWAGWGALGAALFIGALLRFWDLGGHSLFLDEAFTFHTSDQPLPQLVHDVAYHDFHPPLFYVATHYLMQWLHWPLWNYRYLSAPFGLLTILAAWGFARRLFGDGAAGVAALLVALTPGLVQWDRLYRMYSVLVALTAVSWWLLVLAEQSGPKKRAPAWLAYATVSAMLPQLHYLGAFTLLAQGLYALLAPRKRWPVWAAGCAAAAALVPWLWAVRIQAPHGGYVATAGFAGMHWSTLAPDTLAAGGPVVLWTHWHMVPVFTAAVVLLIAAGAWLGRRTALPFWLLTLGLLALAGMLSGKALLVPRYLYPLIPGLWIAAGALVAKGMGGALRLPATAFAALLLAFNGVCTQNVLLVPYYQLPDWYLVNAVVLQNEKRSDAMIFDQGFPWLIVHGYTGFRRHAIMAPAMPSDLQAALHWLDANSAKRVWYIENQFFYPDPQKLIKRHLDRTRRQLGVWSEARASQADQVNIVLYGAARTTLRAR